MNELGPLMLSSSHASPLWFSVAVGCALLTHAFYPVRVSTNFELLICGAGMWASARDLQISSNLVHGFIKMLFAFIAKLSIIKQRLGSDFEMWRVFQECATEIRQGATVQLSVEMQLLKKLLMAGFYFDLSRPKLPHTQALLPKSKKAGILLWG